MHLLVVFNATVGMMLRVAMMHTTTPLTFFAVMTVLCLFAFTMMMNPPTLLTLVGFLHHIGIGSIVGDCLTTTSLLLGLVSCS